MIKYSLFLQPRSSKVSYIISEVPNGIKCKRWYVLLEYWIMNDFICMNHLMHFLYSVFFLQWNHCITKVTKSQIKLIRRLARHWFSQKAYKHFFLLFCFSRQKKIICWFFGRIYSAPICFWFYLTFSSKIKVVLGCVSWLLCCS